VSDAVRFWFRGAVVELGDVAPTRSVLHWLREDAGASGTKEGCNTGDCGACTVVLAEHGVDGVALRTANACLLTVPMLHGRALLTVEDVGDVDRLHPVQRAMMEHAGSQCGFCTPGFVMSMWCATEGRRGTDQVPTRDELADDLTGNLCRCTGYRPILDAAVDAAEQVVVDGAGEPVDLEALSAGLDVLDADGPLHLDAAGGTFLAPTTEVELDALLDAHPGARIIAGGTDLVLSMRATGEWSRDDLVLVSTARVAGLADVRRSDTVLSLGAACSIDAAWATLDHSLPSLGRMRRRFAGPAVRGTGTVGGNLVNASPVADLVPVLVALDAVAVLRSRGAERVLPVSELATGVRTTVLTPGEHVTRVEVPASSLERTVRAHKVSRRFDDDISTVSAVLAVERAPDGVVTDVRLVLGGMATTVRRAPRAEAALLGSRLDDAAVRDAQQALALDFSPIDDHRASASYRSRAAAGLLERICREINGPDAGLDVWGGR